MTNYNNISAMRLVALLLHLVANRVTAHSWIACADYTEKNAGYWNPRHCRGFPRNAAKFAPKTQFGVDNGYDHRPGHEGKACKTTYSMESYSSAYPKAVYFPGQQVILVHPMKTHGAATCPGVLNIGIHIRDTANKIYHGKEGQDRDESYTYYSDKLVADLGASKFGSDLFSPNFYPKPGYQNAPKFCENPDKAAATYSFNVPTDFKPGEYTFVWRWSFNNPEDMYTTCFDVKIAPNKAARDQILLQRSRSSDLSVACGGKLSNGRRGSTVGCNRRPSPTRRPTRKPQTATTNPTRRPITPTPTKPTTVQPQTAPTPDSISMPSAPPLPPTILPPTDTPITNYVGMSGKRVAIITDQMSGQLDIGAPSNDDMILRFLSVRFDCLAKLSFWNARLLRIHNDGGRMRRHAAIRYDLVQEDPQDVASGKVYFTATFDEPCDLLTNPPVAEHLRDEA